MPVIVALAIRSIIQMAVTLGLIELAEKYVLPYLHKAIQEIMEFFGVSEEDAEDIMANEFLSFAESLGIGVLTLRLKLPTKIAERLGFSSKGWSKRTLSPKAKAKVEGKTTTKTTSKVATSAEVAKVGEVIAKSRGISVGVVGSLLNKITGYLGTTALWYLALINTIDFANWEGAYQSTFQKIFSNFGLNPDSAMPKANTLSSDMWKRIYSTIEELEPLGVSFPVSGVDKPYSRQNLADLIDEIASTMVVNGESPTYKKVIGMALPFIQLSGRIKNVSSGAVAPADAKTSYSTPQITKVFTGIVSQGVVGAGLVFEPRPDDMIESIEELRTAAANNLAPFLTSLPGKIVYEVKVVSSIVTKDGFKQTGTTQRIQTGTYQNGQPKYKTVTNKFATLVMYALTDKGSRAKLTTIVLGPVDSAKLLVAQNDLRTLETELPSLVTTTDINEIKGIQTSTPVEVVQTSAPVSASGDFYAYQNGKLYRFNTESDRENYLKQYGYTGLRVSGNLDQLVKLYGQVQNSSVSVPATAPAVSSTVATPIKKGANATTLFEWYQAQGRELPSVSARSVVYASLGLGVQGYYTGTAEQNTKLLNALKQQAS